MFTPFTDVEKHKFPKWLSPELSSGSSSLKRAGDVHQSWLPLRRLSVAGTWTDFHSHPEQLFKKQVRHLRIQWYIVRIYHIRISCLHTWVVSQSSYLMTAFVWLKMIANAEKPLTCVSGWDTVFLPEMRTQWRCISVLQLSMRNQPFVFSK